MDKEFIINSNSPKLYTYYWNQIQTSINNCNKLNSSQELLDADDFKSSLEYRFGEDALSNKNADSWCKYAVMALLIEASYKDPVVGHALKYFLSNGDINENGSTYISDLLSSLPSSSIKLISSQNKVVNIDELRNSIQKTINNYYRDPNHKRVYAPDAELKSEIQKVLNGALRLEMENSSNKNNYFNNNSDSQFSL